MLNLFRTKLRHLRGPQQFQTPVGRIEEKQAVQEAFPQQGAVKFLDQYVTSTPCPENLINLFQGEWSSRLPEPYASLPAGAVGLFEDERITWAAEHLGGFNGKTVLELGPLEAGHTYMLERLGAAEIVAVEANTRAYLKCLVIKELLGLKRARFLCGDFVEYLRGETRCFEAALASGVLYHMRDPVELLALLAAKCDRLFLWTHYYDAQVLQGKPHLAPKFPSATASEQRGFRHTLHRYEYRASLEWKGFCGGSAEFSHWLSREDILSCLRHFGFTDLRIGFDHPDHPNGPAFCVAAIRS